MLIIIAIALLVKPLFKTYSDTELSESQKKADQRKALNIELYEQKKVQIEQDFSNGLLDEEGRIQAQNEIEHSLIHDAEGSVSTELTQLSKSSAIKLSIAFLVLIPVSSVIIYLSIAPDNFEQVVMSQKPEAKPHTAKNQNQVPDIATMVSSLEKKLENDPENAQGWNMLGRSYIVLKRYADAAKAYEKALALVKQNKTQQAMPELEIDYVEALMQAGDINAYQKARNILGGMLAANPDNGDALWFMGFLDYQAGNKEQAVERWTYLLTLLPAEGKQTQIVNTYLSQIKSQMSGANNNQSIEAPQIAKKSEPQAENKPAAKGPAPGQQLTGTAQEQAFIASMVARVEKRVKDNPQDMKGWMSLGKSYGVLNRHVDSANAYAKAVAIDSTDVKLLMAYSDAVIQTGQRDQMDKARIVFAQLVDQNPQNLDALFLSGSLARVAGDIDEARLFWNKLLPQLHPESEAYKNVKINLDSL
ncbi:MAG: c-type cytochrome biogenesis protein CcmI [gamma proteobacterium symbiont of Bathyaustriella thionipta]|nr:c-type cytochrome biogenesis protein CcmI [gamma proteobacterium symbiont of Bathyaustriella thionipta]MCU7954448.1 c-type cytochrome biogenesis protein CcmI [gamma proteobacterium symbiont of Bathyaustriella thionipta]MCU7956813.1 c-type cytochrome biogenesis protein CcmI [gamma proteobacterium symbiont of Bathyaustriella thionipta]MCU7968651.1 c-type cytochrome biogenesis protein CcmI [gamma proteobacterium symbiont of Bathyaustriella thionipta]